MRRFLAYLLVVATLGGTLCARTPTLAGRQHGVRLDDPMGLGCKNECNAHPVPCGVRALPTEGAPVPTHPRMSIAETAHGQRMV